MADTTPERAEGLRTAEDLERLRDELQLKMHLAGMEARSAWERIEPELRHMAAELRRGAEEGGDGQARLDAHLAMMEASERWERVAPLLSPLAAHLLTAGAVAAEDLEARLRGVREGGEPRPRERPEAEGAGDAEARARRERLRRELEAAGNDAAGLARRALTSLRKALDELRARRS